MNLRNHRATILASATFGLVLATIMSACGGDDSGSGDGATAATNTVATNTVATSSGGTSSTTSTTATTTTATVDTTTSSTTATGAGGSTSAGDSTTGGGELPSDMCSGIGNGDACTTPGTCSGRVCGLADTGTRDCTCTTTWDCTSCAWDPIPTWLMQPTEPLAACEAGTEDEVPCDTSEALCDNGDEVCACFLTDDEGALIWDCDNAPSFWED